LFQAGQAHLSLDIPGSAGGGWNLEGGFASALLATSFHIYRPTFLLIHQDLSACYFRQRFFAQTLPRAVKKISAPRKAEFLFSLGIFFRLPRETPRWQG
jgi:hypothetical protein